VDGEIGPQRSVIFIRTAGRRNEPRDERKLAKGIDRKEVSRKDAKAQRKKGTTESTEVLKGAVSLCASSALSMISAVRTPFSLRLGVFA
jgi:hypothetical protein